MFHLGQARGADAILDAIGRALAIIEFDADGKILSANENFCAALGYSISEIKGRHHSIFVEPDYAQSRDYQEFWSKLRRGEFDAREYKRIGKGGREVWIQASYNPVVNARGAVVKVVKVATDITAQKLANAEFESKLNAVSRVQAVIEFKTSGEVITANENFLNTLGYRLEEIAGKHHRMFVDQSYANSAEYADFWRKLNSGEFIAAEFKRIGKGGKDVWIQASYNPIFDADGRVTKVVKFATDVTGRVHAVNEIAAGLNRMAENNLTAIIETSFPKDLEVLRLDYNKSLKSMRGALQQVATAADSIGSGTSQLTIASDNLSRRTEQQAANLEQTAAALDEITAAALKATEGALQAREAVSVTDKDAKKSADIVRKAVEAMDAISRSSAQINNIIGVIDEIAFQTNLLALNAGVEAARAGDSGRGFAVVAQEVRALAQRSADAAKEIKTLISASTRQVNDGVELVGETGHSLERITHQVSEINSIVDAIASGSKEQSTALSEVNTAINQMDQLTQQNAAMVEESTAASRSLANEADHLTKLLGQFRLDAMSSGAKPKPQMQAAPASTAQKRHEFQPNKVRAIGGSNAKSLLAAHPKEEWDEF